MKLIMESWRKFVNEDSISYIKDMVGAQETGEIDRDLAVTDWKDYEDKTNVKSKKAAMSQSKQKDLFRKHADHSWLKTLNTVHWAMSKADPYSLSKLGSKDELSTTMNLPNEPLKPYGRARVGLWIKGHISWATNHQDSTWSGGQDDYNWSDQQVKSSGRNKRPMNIQGQYKDDWQSVLDSGEISDFAKKEMLPVLGSDNWSPTGSDSNEALVDNWKAYAVVVKGDANEILNKFKSDPQGWEKYIRSIEGLAKSYGVPIVGTDRQLILPASQTMKTYLKKLGGSK